MKYTYEACLELIDKPAGYKVHLNNETWVKMADSDLHHIEGMYLNIETGNYRHASHLFEYRAK